MELYVMYGQCFLQRLAIKRLKIRDWKKNYFVIQTQSNNLQKQTEWLGFKLLLFSIPVDCVLYSSGLDLSSAALMFS